MSSSLFLFFFFEALDAHNYALKGPYHKISYAKKWYDWHNYSMIGLLWVALELQKPINTSRIIRSPMSYILIGPYP